MAKRKSFRNMRIHSCIKSSSLIATKTALKSLKNARFLLLICPEMKKKCAEMDRETGCPLEKRKKTRLLYADFEAVAGRQSQKTIQHRRIIDSGPLIQSARLTQFCPQPLQTAG